LATLQKELTLAYRPDVVIASSTHPFDIYPTSQIARRASAKLIFEVHDLWPQTLIELGKFSEWHPFILLMRHAEAFAYHRADKVVSLLPDAEPYMRMRGMSAGKFIHIPNGIDPDEWSQPAVDIPSDHATTIRRLKALQRYVIAYAG